MHHFGPTWDGYEFWKGRLERVEVGGRSTLHDFSVQPLFGSPVGIVRVAAFFALPAAERRGGARALFLREYRAPAWTARCWSGARRRSEGFSQSDVHPFPPAIAAPEPALSLDTSLSVAAAADEKPFSIAPGEMGGVHP